MFGRLLVDIGFLAETLLSTSAWRDLQVGNPNITFIIGLKTLSFLSLYKALIYLQPAITK